MAITARDRMWGRDLWLDATAAGADLITTTAGDLALVEGQECLRQAIIRRIVTNPGDWATLPEYGCGARSYVKARNTKAVRDELAERIRGQLSREARVERVAGVSVVTTDDAAGLRIHVMVIPKGRIRPDDSLSITLEVR